MNLGNIFDKTNFIILTLDCCRWDTFEHANTKLLDSVCEFRKAYTHGTYTLPAHISIFAGILPDVRDDIPYYNRFSKNLFRISARKIKNVSFVEFPDGTKNIIEGFRSKGYKSFGTGAMRWFRHPLLTSSFDDFYYSGIHFESQVNYLLSKVKQNNAPYFLFANIGETHEPYEFGGYIEESLNSRARMRDFNDVGFLVEDFNKQVKCIEYLDSKIYNLIKTLNRHCNDWVVAICGDHGECFGEDGLYGHGFYHEKVMEVPLGIFRIRA
jgi:hypothetical protein